MENMKKVLSFKFKRPFTLWAISDAHIGAREHDSVKFRALIEKIKNDPDAYCFFNGDNLELIPPGYYISQEGQTLTVEQQVEAFIALLKELGRKVLFVRAGNHENRTFNLCGVDIIKRIAEEVGVPILGMGMQAVNFKVEGRKIKIVSTHGEGGNFAKIMASMQMGMPGADLYFMGHTHEMVCNSSYEIVATEGYERHTPILLVVGGSFSKWADYAREKNRRPLQTGCFAFRLSKDGLQEHGRFV